MKNREIINSYRINELNFSCLDNNENIKKEYSSIELDFNGLEKLLKRKSSYKFEKIVYGKETK